MFFFSIIGVCKRLKKGYIDNLGNFFFFFIWKLLVNIVVRVS